MSDERQGDGYETARERRKKGLEPIPDPWASLTSKNYETPTSKELVLSPIEMKIKKLTDCFRKQFETDYKIIDNEMDGVIGYYRRYRVLHKRLFHKEGEVSDLDEKKRELLTTLKNNFENMYYIGLLCDLGTIELPFDQRNVLSKFQKNRRQYIMDMHSKLSEFCMKYPRSHQPRNEPMLRLSDGVLLEIEEIVNSP